MSANAYVVLIGTMSFLTFMIILLGTAGSFGTFSKEERAARAERKQATKRELSSAGGHRKQLAA